MKILCIGDAMIAGEQFRKACDGLQIKNRVVLATDWEADWDRLQNRRLFIEKQGPEAEPVLPAIMQADKDTDVLLVLFAPVSAGAMDVLPGLRLIGAARAGLENIDVRAATERGIVVQHLLGRNAHAVSDFTVGLLLAEARNIARAHHAIRQGVWRKEFANSASVPELRRRVVGIIGFGHIGRLVARKLAGFGVRILVFDPLVSDEILRAHSVERAALEDLLTRSDFVTLHARLTEENKGMIAAPQLALMKPTAVLINTARAGLIDEDALFAALEAREIAGAALDVFWTEPLPAGSRWRQLDNVTLTTHIAGTTADVLTNSPYLLAEDINKLLTGGSPEFVVNPQALTHPHTKAWLASLVAQG